MVKASLKAIRQNKILFLEAFLSRGPLSGRDYSLAESSLCQSYKKFKARKPYYIL